VFDTGRDAASGLPFLVMEMLTGEDVDQTLLRIGPLRPDLALRILAHACMGLHKAHGARVIHRDIKPANLFLARRDEGQISVKLLDFGVAKIKMEEAILNHPDLTGTSSSCPPGTLIGATTYRKLGLVRAWPDTMDRGRFDITRRPTDFMVFRVPTLRNVASTAPYFHDGSISSLEEAVRLTARHQLGEELTAKATGSIATWLRCLSGELPHDYIKKPALPESGPSTPPLRAE
jgi:serine/threonine protein kinase